MIKTEDFVKRVQEKRGNEIDTSKIEYVNSRTNVCIICHNKDRNGNEHGEYWIRPYDLLKGGGCPKCANEKRGRKSQKILNTDNLINEAKNIHGNKYDYSKTKYKGTHNKICIICPEHGEFWQLPHIHLKGQGCPKCAGRGLSQEDIIKKFKEIHGDAYDYSKFVFTKMHTKSVITCPIHGDFLQSASKHLLGQGCPKCGNKKKNKEKTTTLETFIRNSNIVHHNKYDYSNIKSIDNVHQKVPIICPKHGEFMQMAYDHLGGHGCPKCGSISSNAENEIATFLKKKGIENIMLRDRKTIAPYELDIFIPDYNIAIEYDGLIWHSEKYNINKYSHLNKLETCNEKGINLIHIFEDEYLLHKEIVLAKISHLIGKDNNKAIYARNLIVKNVSNKEAMEFLNKNHIQGYIPSSITIGLYDNDKLYSLMSFRKEKNGYLLNRCVSDINYDCVGHCSKLFNFFCKKYNPTYVKSFADRRWTLSKDNNMYTKLGFVLSDILPPDYSYVTSKGIRQHKFNFRKKLILKKYPNHNLTMDMTESEMTEKIGVYKIWDCGLFKYEWVRE